jgi:hypothetical protein
MKRRSIAHTLTRAPFSKALLGVGLLLTLAGLRPGSQLSGAPLRAQQPPRQAGVAELNAARRVAKRIDEAVLRDLRRFGIEPAERCEDATFLRRVHIDLFAELPPAEDVRRFVADRRKDKRERLVHLMLADKRYADAWALKFSDMLRIKAEFPINLWPNAAQCYYQWVWSSLRQNRPWSEMLRELVTSSGSNFRVPTVNFYRAVQRKSPEGIAAVAALTLLGQRYEKWSEARQQGFAAFFCRVGYKPTQEWKEEIVHFDRFKELPKGSPGADGIARCPGASVTQLLEGVDPRVQLADALLSKENPHVARAMANRIWFWLLGRGVVHEADDLRDDNPPANPRLLELLTAELQRSGYDMQHLIRSILLSGTYQQSVKAKTRSPLAESHFAYYVPRRMDAEMLIDAICALTGTSEDYSSKIPRAVHLHPPIVAGDDAARRQHFELVPRDVRQTDARQRHALRAQQQGHGDAASTPAQLEPHHQEAAEQPLADGHLLAHATQPGAHDRRPLSDDPLALSQPGRAREHPPPGQGRKAQWARRLRRSRLGPRQYLRIPAETLTGCVAAPFRSNTTLRRSRSMSDLHSEERNWTRRQVLRAGALGAAALATSDPLRAIAQQAAHRAKSQGPRRHAP